MLPYIDLPFQYLAGLTGASTDELKLVTSFLASYPLAAVLKRIPDAKPTWKNLFIITVAAFYLVGLYDMWDGLATILFDAAGAYAIAYFIKGPYMPWIGFVFLMGHLSVEQLKRQFMARPDVIDITGAQMVMVMKLTAFCWNVADGRLPDKDLSEQQREYAIQKVPNLLDFAGYVFFFPSLFAGPSFDYNDYRKWIETTMFDVPAGTDPAKKPPTRKKRKIPRSGTPAMWKLAEGLAWIFVFLVVGPRYPNQLYLSDDFMTYGFLRRVWMLHMLGVTTRLKYYGVWTLTEGACILSGLGYRGVDPVSGRVRWDRLQNVDPWGVETAQNSRAYLGSWNMNTNNWLRNYMYLRVTPRGRKPGFRASMATFVTSAFWHGFYPGYYLTFVLASFIQTVAKNFRRYLRPFFLDPITQQPTAYKPIYDAFSILATQAAFSFTVAPFVLLTMKDSWLVWSRVYFYTIAGIAASLAFFASPAKGMLIKQLKTRQANAGKGIQLKRTGSSDSISQMQLGVPPADLDKIAADLKEEMEELQKQAAQSGISISFPEGVQSKKEE